MTHPAYNPAVFGVRNIDEAKRIILTPEGGSTDERWERETPFIAELAVKYLQLSPDSLLLDYGCGIGRVSRAIYETVGCSAVGVDISPQMRALGTAHVGVSNFVAMSPEMFRLLNLNCQAAISIWVLQHVEVLEAEVNTIYNALTSGDRFLLVNNQYRALPVNGGRWYNDGLDVRKVVTDKFGGRVVASGKLPAEICPPGLSDLTFWEVYER